MAMTKKGAEGGDMGDPSKEEFDDFIKANDIDERAATGLRECPPAVQRAVLARGDLSTARNPSAALLVRIRDARVGGSGCGASSASVGLPSSADIKAFIKRNEIDHSTGDALRSSSPTIKRAVLAGGDLVGAHNPSAVLAARIADYKRAGSTSVMLSAGMTLPSSAHVEDFLKMNDVDKNSADQLRNSPPIVQRVVISRGDLRSARNASAALLARIRDAKIGVPDGMMPGMMAAEGAYPGFPGAPPGFPEGFGPPGGYLPHMGCFPPPGGYPPPPGDGNQGSSSGYPPPGYPMYPGGYYGGYPEGAYPGYPGGPYGGFPGGGYPCYGPPAPGGGSAPGTEGGPGQRKRSRGGGGGGRRSRSSSSSYSGSYSYSRSRSRSEKRGGRHERAGRR